MGFGLGSSLAWQVLPFAGYRFANWFELSLAYRELGMDYETGSESETFAYDMTIFGPQIGVPRAVPTRCREREDPMRPVRRGGGVDAPGGRPALKLSINSRR